MDELRRKAGNRNLRRLEKEDPALTERIYNEDPEFYNELYELEYHNAAQNQIEKKIVNDGVMVLTQDEKGHKWVNGLQVSEEQFENLTRNRNYYLTGVKNLEEIKNANNLKNLISQLEAKNLAVEI
jgi:hypothetical protein